TTAAWGGGCTGAGGGRAGNDRRGPAATSSDNERHRSPGRSGHATIASPNARLQLTFHTSRLTGIRKPPYKSHWGDRPSIDPPLPSASHSAVAATPIA